MAIEHDLKREEKRRKERRVERVLSMIDMIQDSCVM